MFCAPGVNVRHHAVDTVDGAGERLSVSVIVFRVGDGVTDGILEVRWLDGDTSGAYAFRKRVTHDNGCDAVIHGAPAHKGWRGRRQVLWGVIGIRGTRGTRGASTLATRILSAALATSAAAPVATSFAPATRTYTASLFRMARMRCRRSTVLRIINTASSAPVCLTFCWHSYFKERNKSSVSEFQGNNSSLGFS